MNKKVDPMWILMWSPWHWRSFTGPCPDSPWSGREIYRTNFPASGWRLRPLLRDIWDSWGKSLRTRCISLPLLKDRSMYRTSNWNSQPVMCEISQRRHSRDVAATCPNTLFSACILFGWLSTVVCIDYITVYIHILIYYVLMSVCASVHLFVCSNVWLLDCANTS